MLRIGGLREPFWDTLPCLKWSCTKAFLFPLFPLAGYPVHSCLSAAGPAVPLERSLHHNCPKLLSKPTALLGAAWAGCAQQQSQRSQPGTAPHAVSPALVAPGTHEHCPGRLCWELQESSPATGSTPGSQPAAPAKLLDPWHCAPSSNYSSFPLRGLPYSSNPSAWWCNFRIMPFVSDVNFGRQQQTRR